MQIDSSFLTKVKLPDSSDPVLFLICEELKSRRFFNGLMDVGLDYTNLQPHLDELIMACLGLDGACDGIFDKYQEIMQRRSRQITIDKDSVRQQAMWVYRELMGEGK